MESFFLLLYVDDIILTSSNPNLLNDFLLALNHELDMKDLGPLHYLLGIRVTNTTKGLLLSHTKYVLDILLRAQMKDCQPMPTSMTHKTKNSSRTHPYSNPSHYLSIVDTLQ